LEKFSGNVAELIIFARVLTPAEYSSVEDYLDAKYFGASPGQPGDYDGDGDVDSGDLAVWRGQFGGGPPADPNADGDNDGDVDGADFLNWQRNFGADNSVSASVGIPEPGSLSLQLFALTLVALSVGNRARRLVRTPWPGAFQAQLRHSSLAARSRCCDQATDRG
jgi:hypothetical protein